MSYFKDLTLYSYSRAEKSPVEVLNIGWLGKSESFVTGETSREFQEKLHSFCLDENVVLIMRGFHACEFCGLSWEEWNKKHANYGNNSGLMSGGNGEIRVIGKDVIYAAPALIYHYVIEHQYSPPPEFIEAISTGPQPGSGEHRTLLETYRRKGKL